MSTENKKIRNASPLEYDGIQFKSTLERNVYRVFKDAGIDIQYEPSVFTLWEGFKPKVPFYDKVKGNKELQLVTKKIIDIRYTPDFVVSIPPVTAYIEAKGMENDVFYIKKKLFRSLLETSETPCMYFEVYTIGHAKQAITLIKDYAEKLQGNQPSNN